MLWWFSHIGSSPLLNILMSFQNVHGANWDGLQGERWEGNGWRAAVAVRHPLSTQLVVGNRFAHGSNLLEKTWSLRLWEFLEFDFGYSSSPVFIRVGHLASTYSFLVIVSLVATNTKGGYEGWIQVRQYACWDNWGLLVFTEPCTVGEFECSPLGSTSMQGGWQTSVCAEKRSPSIHEFACFHGVAGICAMCALRTFTRTNPPAGLHLLWQFYPSILSFLGVNLIGGDALLWPHWRCSINTSNWIIRHIYNMCDVHACKQRTVILAKTLLTVS